MFSNGVRIYKWPHEIEPTEELVKKEMKKFGYAVYDLQTLPAWFYRSEHAHDYEEIRAAVKGCITFHFDQYPITIEAGDIIVIPAHIMHTVKSHNAHEFSAFKGNTVGKRSVTEHGDGVGSVEYLKSLENTKETK